MFASSQYFAEYTASSAQPQQSHTSASSASCSQDAVHSFGWSDLPCQGDYLIDVSSLISPSTTSDPSFFSQPEPVLTSTDTHPNTQVTATKSSNPPTTSALNKVERSTCPTSTTYHHDRPTRVSFGKFLQVRTYDVIVGSHPWCRGGMALECGWDHNGSELVDMDMYEEYSTKRRIPALHLDLAKRRERLQRVTGMSPTELLAQEHDVSAQEKDM